MLPTDNRLNEFLRMLEPIVKPEAQLFAPIFWEDQNALLVKQTVDYPWESLQPKAVQTGDLPGVCWWLLHQQEKGNQIVKQQIDQVQKQYQWELRYLLEKSEKELYLRTSFLLNYFALACQLGGQNVENQDFLLHLPIEQYIEQMVHRLTVPLSFAAGITPMSITLARLCRVLPLKSSLSIIIRDWLNDLTGLIRQYLLPVRMNEQLFSFFPTSISRSDDTCETAQHLTWAFGDLNQVFLFRAVAPVLNDMALLKLAERVGEFTTFHQALEAKLVEDISVGRGTAGLTLMYDQLYRQTGSSAYLKARSYWLERTTAQSFPPTDTTSADFLHGPIGTFLALQAIRKPDNLLASILFLN